MKLCYFWGRIKFSKNLENLEFNFRKNNFANAHSAQKIKIKKFKFFWKFCYFWGQKKISKNLENLEFNFQKNNFENAHTGGGRIKMYTLEIVVFDMITFIDFAENFRKCSLEYEEHFLKLPSKLIKYFSSYRVTKKSY